VLTMSQQLGSDVGGSTWGVPDVDLYMSLLAA
jgi:hypothetical protein